MKRILTSIVVALLAASPFSFGAQSGAQPAKIDWNLKAPWGPWQSVGPRAGKATETTREPFRIFDNVYYVGLHFVSSYLVTTSNGLVLIDATFAETSNSVLDGVRKLGFDPSNIKYIFITHSHLDHFGGAGKIKQVTGARVGMSLEDWQSVEKQQSGANGQNLAVPLTRDLIIKDNDTIKVGDATFKFYFTPGHTAGATSIEYQVRDRGKSYRAISPGGMGIAFGPEWTPVFIKSIERLKQLGPWDVVLGNHPFLAPRDLELNVERDLATRGNGPHPAVVAPAEINEWFDAVLKVANEKLATEQAQSKR